MSYATVADVRHHIGDRALSTLVPKVEGESVDDLVERRLVAASGWVDTHLEVKGYQTPVDLVALDMVAAGLSGQIVHAVVVAALHQMAPGASAPKEGLEVEYREVKDWLTGLPMTLPIPRASDRRSFGVADRSLRPAFPSGPGNPFQRIRRFGGR